MAKLNQILMGLALLLCAAPLAAQSCYVQLDDATGLPLPPAQLAELEAAACELRDAFPAEFQGDFAVYDFGFYLHQEGFAGGVPEVFQAKVAEVSSQSGAYLLFGHEVGRDGGSVRLWTSFSFDSEDYECLDAASLDVAIRGISGGQGDSNAAHVKKLAILRALESELTEGFCCSAYYASEEGGRDGQPRLRASGGESVCVDNAKVDAAFQELLNDAVYVLMLRKIAAIAAFYQNCANQEWKPGAENGIIPKCIWENAPVPLHGLYTGLDLPFYSGATDGLYSEAKGVADFLLSLDDFAGGVASVIQSYTMWYLVCEKEQSSKLNKAEYNKLMDELKAAEPQWQPSLFSDFSLGNYLREASAAVVAYFDVEDYCKGLENTRNTVETIYEAISQKDTWVGIYNSIVQEASVIWQNIDGLSNEERYYQGYYGVKVGVNFLPMGFLTKAKYLDEVPVLLNTLLSRVSGSNKASFIVQFGRNLTAARIRKMKSKAPIKDWPPNKRDDFFNDFYPDFADPNNIPKAAENYAKLRKMDEEGMIRAWEVFFPDQATRVNTAWLQKLDGYLAGNPGKLSEVKDQFAIEKGKNRITAYLMGLLERKHYDGVVYRGDKASLTPAQAFSNGILPQGAHDNLIKHLDGGNVNKGNFVSTSKDITIADGFAGNNGYVFKVRSRNGKGVDVNQTLGDEAGNWFPEQLEVSIVGKIDKADIIGAYPKGQYSASAFISNPNYVP